jgi:hypothetical protein
MFAHGMGCVRGRKWVRDNKSNGKKGMGGTQEKGAKVVMIVQPQEDRPNQEERSVPC